jgi:serine kinase of HPr protein (carbohydrate metabolism regulator)
MMSVHGAEVMAVCPPAIAGLIELRGTGIVTLASVGPSVMHYAIVPAQTTGSLRLPPDDEMFVVAPGIELPAIRLLANVPFPLAVLMAKAADIGR